MFMSQPARLVMRATEKPVMKYYDDGGRQGARQLHVGHRHQGAQWSLHEG